MMKIARIDLKVKRETIFMSDRLYYIPAFPKEDINGPNQKLKTF